MKYRLQTRLTFLAVHLALTGVALCGNTWAADVTAGQLQDGSSGPIDQKKIKQNEQKSKLEPLKVDPNALLMGKSKTNAIPKDPKEGAKEEAKVDTKEQKPNPFGGSEVSAAPTTKERATGNHPVAPKTPQSAAQQAEDDSHVNPMTGKAMSVEDLDMRLAKTTKLALIAEQEKRIRELTPTAQGAANTQNFGQGTASPTAPMQAAAPKVPTLSKKEKLALEKMEKDRRAQAAMPPPAQYPQLVGLMNQSGRTMAMISLGGETVVVGKGEMVYGRHIDAVDERGVTISGIRIGLNNALEATRFTSVDEQKVASTGSGNNGASGNTAVSAIARISTSSTVSVDGANGQARTATGAGVTPNYSGPMPAPLGLGQVNSPVNTGLQQTSAVPAAAARNQMVAGSIAGANVPSSPSANSPAN